MNSQRPNILWYCADQQRYDTIGALGFPAVSTPNIDALVEDGVAFTRAYTQSPICTPSRARFLTGHYPSRVHINRNGNESFPKRPALITRLLADAGYDCGLVGKLHLTSAYRRVETRADDGYRYWKWSHAPRDNWPEATITPTGCASRGKAWPSFPPLSMAFRRPCTRPPGPRSGRWSSSPNPARVRGCCR